jgi:enoyl-CoA hydratase
MPDDILLDKKDGIATVTFNQPERHNPISYEGWLEIQRLAAVLADDAEVRVVVFTGAGDKAFSAGADIKDFELHRSDEAAARRYAAAIDGALDAVERLPQPTICRIHGFCVGGGCEFSTATDMRIAADNSQFGVPAARLSVLVGYGEMRRLTHLVGPGATAYLLLSGRLIDAPEALRIGLVTQVVPLAELCEYTDQLAAEMARLAPLTQKYSKQILQIILRNPDLQNLSPEEEALPYAAADSEDFEEGRRAFLERRPAHFKGR